MISLASLALVSAIYSGETQVLDMNSQFTKIDSYSLSENTSAITVNIDGNTTINYTLPEDYAPGTFIITLYGWQEEQPVVRSIESRGKGGCIAAWSCSSWSQCLENGTQSRTCQKTSAQFPSIAQYCYAAPVNLTQNCVYISSEQNETRISPTSNLTSGNGLYDYTKIQWSYIIIGVLAAIVILAIIIIYFLMPDAPKT